MGAPLEGLHNAPNLLHSPLCITDKDVSLGVTRRDCDDLVSVLVYRPEDTKVTSLNNFNNKILRLKNPYRH